MTSEIQCHRQLDTSLAADRQNFKSVHLSLNISLYRLRRKKHEKRNIYNVYDQSPHLKEELQCVK